MMNFILQNHLSQTEPAEMFSLYDRAIALFDAYGQEAEQEQMEEILATADGAVDGMGEANNAALYEYVVLVLDNILRQHQISLTEDASLKARIEVLEFIKQLDATELIEECKLALDCDETDNTDKFVQCMATVTGLQEEDILTYMQPVLDCVIKVLKEFINRRCEFELATEELDDDIKNIYREFDKYSRAVGGSGMVSHQYLFDHEGAVGLPLVHYYETNKQYLRQLTVDDMVLELIGFSIMSEDGFNNPSKAIMQAISKDYDDLNEITKIQMTVQQTLLQYRNEIASGVSIIN